MSKKNYQAIARALHSVRPLVPDTPDVAFIDEARWTWESVLEALASVFAADNPRFDRERFIEACETGHCRGMKA